MQKSSSRFDKEMYPFKYDIRLNTVLFYRLRATQSFLIVKPLCWRHHIWSVTHSCSIKAILTTGSYNKNLNRSTKYRKTLPPLLIFARVRVLGRLAGEGCCLVLPRQFWNCWSLSSIGHWYLICLDLTLQSVNISGHVSTLRERLTSDLSDGSNVFYPVYSELWLICLRDELLQKSTEEEPTNASRRLTMQWIRNLLDAFHEIWW